MDSIEYQPEDSSTARHRRVMGELTVHRRNMRERRQAKAAERNKPFREAEEARKARQPGRERA